MSAAFVTAWLVIATVTGQPLAQLEVRIEPRACHISAINGERAVNGQWQRVKVFVRCAR